MHVGAPGPPHDADLIYRSAVSDVRCRPATTPCGNANTAGGADYTGELQGNAMLRVTDHDNAIDPGGGTDPATLVDIPFPINFYCASTADPSTGSICNVSTYCPLPEPCGPREGNRTLVQISRFEVFDGGPDGIVATDDNEPFLSQGLFVP